MKSMDVIDDNLRELLRSLTLRERRAVSLHVRDGIITPMSLRLIRQLRRELKRKARSRPPAKAQWLV